MTDEHLKEEGSISPEDPTSPTELDLTSEPTDSEHATPRVASIEQQREDTRRTVAISLLWGLAAISLAWGAVGVWGDNGDAARAGEALSTIFTGVLGLSGTAVGFYFGVGGKDKGEDV